MKDLDLVSSPAAAHWKDALSARIDPKWREDIDAFETDIVLKKRGKTDGHRWVLSHDRMAEAISKDRHHLYEIVGCVTSPTGVFQIQPPRQTNQLGSYPDLREILERHPDAALVRWMRRFNRGRFD